MSIINQVRDLLDSVLRPEHAGNHLNIDSPLLGAIPEFDSMAVVSIIAALEEQFGFTIEDDEIDASVFETVGSVVTFVELKLHAA